MTLAVQAPAGWQEGWIESETRYPAADGTCRETIRLHYWRVPNPGKPKLLFLHGWAEYGLDFERLARPFQTGYDILAPDARAHGLSDGPPSQYTIRERMDDVLAVLTALDFHPCLLIGHSMGANVGAGLAIEHPQWVRGLMLIDPSWGGGLETMNAAERSEASAYWDRTIHQWERFSEQQLLRFADTAYDDWHPADRRRWVEGKKMLKRTTLNGYDHPVPMWDTYIDAIPCPGVLVTGSPELGAVVSAEKAAASAHRWKGLFRTLHVPGAGHYIHHHATAALQAGITELIGRVYGDDSAPARA
jgi:pimeloyl-ACP methyl ester carboxylesterase